MIIGKGGASIKSLQSTTSTRINVPRQAHHAVRVEGEDVASVLHALFLFTRLGISAESPVDCTIRIAEGFADGSASLKLEQLPTGEFLSGSSGLTAYCLQSSCSADTLDVLIDNVSFTHPEATRRLRNQIVGH